MAAFGGGDIRAYSRAITAKTVVIHGASDPLMRPAAGKAVARCIKGSGLEVIPGMGHYLHPELWDWVAGSLHEVIAKAQELAKGGPLPSEAIGRIYQKLVEEMRDWEAKIDNTKP